MTRHCSTRTFQELAPLLFLLFVSFVCSRVLPPISLCCFLRFHSPRSLRIGCASVFIRIVSPVERVSGNTPKNLQLQRWLALFRPRLSPLPFFLLPSPGFRRIPFSFSFYFCAGFRPCVPFSPFSGCEFHLTLWSPEPGQRVVPSFLRWLHTASNMPSQRQKMFNLLSTLSLSYLLLNILLTLLQRALAD